MNSKSLKLKLFLIAVGCNFSINQALANTIKNPIDSDSGRSAISSERITRVAGAVKNLREKHLIELENARFTRDTLLNELQSLFKKYEVPEYLIDLAFIESNFNQNSFSKYGNAVGMWQLTPGTAKNFGLIINRNKDERKDVWLSTEAAIKHLADLRKEFDSWELAVVAYNCGEWRLKKAIENGKTEDVDILISKGLLPKTSINYLNKITALTVLKLNEERIATSIRTNYEEGEESYGESGLF